MIFICAGIPEKNLVIYSNFYWTQFEELIGLPHLLLAFFPSTLTSRVTVAVV